MTIKTVEPDISARLWSNTTTLVFHPKVEDFVVDTINSLLMNGLRLLAAKKVGISATLTPVPDFGVLDHRLKPLFG